MTTYSINQVYYQVTWTQNSPTNYSALTGNQSGGLDPISAWNVNRLISVTGSAAIGGTPMAAGETIIINQYAVAFAATDTLADIVNKINLASEFTNVVADQSVAGTYLTLKNAPTTEGQPFWLAEGNGSALSKLGIPAGTYSAAPAEIGSAFISPTIGSNVTVNGIDIVFTTSGLANTAARINTFSSKTGVAASVAGPYLQLASTNGQPWVINGGNAVSSLGTTLGNHGGYPATLDDSLSKERANMRWTQTVASLQENSTPQFVGNFTRTGNVANASLTSVTFTLGYGRPDNIYTVARTGEPDAGNVYVGATAIRRQVARALVSNMVQNRKLFDPTLENYGAYTDRPNAGRIEAVTASGIDTVANIAIVENNISVVQVPGV